MNVPGRTPILAAALVFAAFPLLASAAPATKSRTLDGPTTPVLDNFNRANENPLTGGGNWERLDAGAFTNDLELLDLKVRGRPVCIFCVAMRYWTPQTVGPDSEVHIKRLGVAQLGEGWRLVLRGNDVAGPNTFDGYELTVHKPAGGTTWYLRRFTNGVAAATLSQVEHGGTQWILFRAVGDQLEGWGSDDFVNWTLVVSASDPTYPNAGYLGIGTQTDGSGSGPEIDDFGGGTLGGPPPPSGPPLMQSRGICTGRGVHAIATSRCLSDPVNTLSGAFVSQVEDLATPGTSVSFAWSRSYTSEDPTVGRLGPGWTDSYATSLLVQGNGDVILHGDEGQQVYYTKQGDGSFVGAAGSLSTLSLVEGVYKLVRADQVTYTFTAQGVLTSIKDRNEQGLTLAYDGQSRLSTITDAASRPVTVTYNASNLVSQIQTQDGRSVSYSYTSGRLTSVTDVRGKTWTYSYDGGGRLATIVDPLNHTQVQNVYGGDGRVQTQTDAVQKTTTFAWDPATEVATVSDANQKVWKHDYDASVLAKEIDPLSNVTQSGHDPDLNTSSVTGPTNETTSMTYDPAGNLLSATAPASLGSVQKTFVFNSRNDPTQVTDARGKVTSYTYTPAGNTETVTQDGTQVASYSYDPAGRVLTFTDGRNKTWTYTYDGNGNLASETDPGGNITTYSYDGAGRVVTRVDPKGNCSGCTPANFTWTWTYNAAGQQLTETNPLGQVTTNVYDDAGRLQSVTDANNHTTSFSYDDANRVLTETAPDPDGAGPLSAPVTSYSYDSVGNKLTETDPRGNVTSLAYDGANRLSSETGADPDGAGPLAAPVTTYAYDPNGNLESTVEPRGNVAGCNCASDYRTSYGYDAAGRQLTETRPDPDGGGPQIAPVTTNSYDPVGNLASVRDANNHTTSYTYDAAGRILTVTAPDTGLTNYTYDPAGNLLTRRDDNTHLTTFAYTAVGRLLSETGPDPDGAGPLSAPVTSYGYDRNGNRSSLTDPNGNSTPTADDGKTSYGYDRANRLTSIDYSDQTPDVNFTYDAVGNRLTMADGSGAETRTYDALDRLLSVTRGTDTFSYAYDPAGNLTSRTYPGAVSTTYTYDTLNRLQTAENASLTTSYTYDVASNLTSTVLPSANGHTETRVYDRAGRLIEVKNERAGGTLRSRFLITLDPAGNPTLIDRTGSLVQTQTYSYDANDRILSVCFAASCSPGSPDLISWTYDKVGNRLSETRSTGTTAYTYDARDRLLSAGATSYSYDQNGNELSAGSTTFTYDLANRLKTAVQGATTTTYSYDGDGTRLQSSTGSAASAKTNFLWDVNQDLPQLALERNGNNVLQRQYICGQRRIRQTQGSGASYYLYDRVGSVANTTAPAGSLQKTYSYEPFGIIRTESGTSPANFWFFTGEYLDPTGLYHLRARQYDSAIGRLLSVDPVTRETSIPYTSGYVYAENRPTVLIDPAGLRAEPSSAWRIAIGRPTSAVRTLQDVQHRRTAGPASSSRLIPSSPRACPPAIDVTFHTGPSIGFAFKKRFGYLVDIVRGRIVVDYIDPYFYIAFITRSPKIFGIGLPLIRLPGNRNVDFDERAEWHKDYSSHALIHINLDVEVDFISLNFAPCRYRADGDFIP